ncbi:hypothetical protein AOQ84DRAFT_390495 [Glonium stellatum]|uniref:Uncharacterized protein n=1 Tax=Glonium stellatum TaxID=574774 RepID=A0A8E2EWE2_9PEZI|nr:hypothetical protein AOQ84DRAFT_390495 [Glonium stellatum]
MAITAVPPRRVLLTGPDGSVGFVDADSLGSLAPGLDVDLDPSVGKQVNGHGGHGGQASLVGKQPWWASNRGGLRGQAPSTKHQAPKLPRLRTTCLSLTSPLASAGHWTHPLHRKKKSHAVAPVVRNDCHLFPDLGAFEKHRPRALISCLSSFISEFPLGQTAPTKPAIRPIEAHHVPAVCPGSFDTDRAAPSPTPARELAHC